MAPSMQPSPQSPLQAGLSRLWRRPLVPHLKASNSEAAGVAGGGHHGHQEGAVGDVLLVELHRDLVVSCWRRRRRHVGKRSTPPTATGGCGSTHRGLGLHPPGAETPPTWLLSYVGDAAGAVFVVVEGDLRPAGSLHRDGETPGTGLPGPDAELSW